MKLLHFAAASLASIAACGTWAGTSFNSAATAAANSNNSQGSAAPASGVQGSSIVVSVPRAVSAAPAPMTVRAPSTNPYSAAPGAPYNPANAPATVSGQQTPLPGPLAFSDLDRNGDGRLTQAESGLTAEQFNRRDTNHDGVLSNMEYSSPLP